MPELPDVQVYKKYLDATGLHQAIGKVSVRNSKVLQDTTASALGKALNGRTFKKTCRHGKFLFAETDSDKTVMFHFGMTGSLRYYKEDEDEPEHSRVKFDFSNGYHLSYICQRMFGRVGILSDIGGFLEEKKVGPDALNVSREDFKTKISGSRGKLKTTLMDQGKIAGIGNIYSDEILFQAGIHPRKKASALDNEQLNTLFDQTEKVCKTAVKHKVDPDHFPKTYLTRFRKKGEDCPFCGGTIQTMKINNRTCYYCPSHQGE